MICQQCGKDTKEYKIISHNGVVQYVCLDCYQDNQEEQLFHLGSFLESVQSPIMREEASKVCDQCGASFDDFKRTGLLGCGHCYEVFYSSLLPIIEKIQGSTRYMGKSLSQDHDNMEEQIQKLEQQIQVCVQQEAYEKAAFLKKQLDFLKGENYGSK